MFFWVIFLFVTFINLFESCVFWRVFFLVYFLSCLCVLPTSCLSAFKHLHLWLPAALMTWSFSPVSPQSPALSVYINTYVSVLCLWSCVSVVPHNKIVYTVSVLLILSTCFFYFSISVLIIWEHGLFPLGAIRYMRKLKVLQTNKVEHEQHPKMWLTAIR